MSGSAVGERCSRGGARSRRVIALLGAVVLLSLGDLLVTLAYLKSVGLMEANPIVAYLIESTQSVWVLAGYKGLTVGICATVLFCLRRHREGEIGAWCAAAILGLTALQWHQYARSVDGPDIRLVGAGDPGEHLLWLP